jgi:asparagine synthase (glutamine-hydrolysing)
MCGIAGIFKFGVHPTPPAYQPDVAARLRHRGADGEGHFINERVAMYHARLEIIDTTAASSQPWSIAGGPILVFNGEIFNYRVSYQQRKYATEGDVEVLYYELKDKGIDALSALNGFFAFALYDADRQEMLVARDRFGVKPLFYYCDGDTFAFASEIAPLLALTGQHRINQDQLYSYFRYNYSAGTSTIFENIYRLAPGSAIRINTKGITIENWYKPEVIHPASTFEQLLEDAVKLRLHADVPVGCFLSGGLDSSIISALAIKHKPDLHTFTIGFKEQSWFDESSWSERVAKHIGSEHHVFRLSEDDFLNSFDGFLGAIDEPFADSSAFNVYVLSGEARKHIKVALSGDGADELYKGYRKHRALSMMQKNVIRNLIRATGIITPGIEGGRNTAVGNRFRQLKKLQKLAGADERLREELSATISGHNHVKELLRSTFSRSLFDQTFEIPAHLSSLSLGTALDLNIVLADDMLVKADRFSMQQGLEIRNPFLDYRVVEHAMGLPVSEKINRKDQKVILKKTFGHYLPKEVLTRSKKGFEIPLKKWLTGALRSKVENEWLNKDRLQSEGVFHTEAVWSLWQKLNSGQPGDSAARIWAIIIYQNWSQHYREFIKR